MKPLSRQYLIKNSHLLVTPALVVFPEIIEMNIKQMVKMSSDPLKLRPHVKTYKMAEVVKLQLNHGIKKFKAATFAESEMVAEADIVKVSVIGVGMRSHAGVAQIMFRALADRGINIHAISTSEIKISVLIGSEFTELAVRTLHSTYGLDFD